MDLINMLYMIHKDEYVFIINENRDILISGPCGTLTDLCSLQFDVYATSEVIMIGSDAFTTETVQETTQCCMYIQINTEG